MTSAGQDNPYHALSRAAALAASLAATEGGAHVDAPLGAGTQHLVSHAHDTAVDGAGDAVLQLHVELGEREGAVDAGIADITLGRGVDHVAHLEALDGLILGHAPTAV